jgi:ubiquinone/menaquinone biosynthesis C-methylase UbiE
MEAEKYDPWCAIPRGKWSGRCELDLLVGVLQPRAGESLIVVGGGTGFFTRELHGRITGQIIGIDINDECPAHIDERRWEHAYFQEQG